MELFKLKENVRILMKLRKVSVYEISILCGVTDQAVYQWLNGKIGTYWWRIKIIAERLKVYPEDIAEMSDKMMGSKRKNKKISISRKKQYELDRPCGLSRALEIVRGEKEYLCEYDKRRIIYEMECEMRESRANDTMRKALEKIAKWDFQGGENFLVDCIRQAKELARETLGKVGSNEVKNYRRDDQEK